MTLGGSRKGPLKNPCSVLGSVCLKSHHLSCSFSIPLSRAPNGSSRGAGHNMNIGGVPAVEDLTLMLSVALGPRGVQDVAPRSWGPAWASTSQGPGGEGVGTSSRERSRTRTAPKSEDRSLGLSK